jgi:hypothetical protein
MMVRKITSTNINNSLLISISKNKEGHKEQCKKLNLLKCFIKILITVRF